MNLFLCPFPYAKEGPMSKIGDGKGGSSASWTSKNMSYSGVPMSYAGEKPAMSMATQSQLQQSKSTSNAQRTQQQIIASNIAQQKAKQQQYMGYAKNISSKNA